jgi:hypothetical protein
MRISSERRRQSRQYFKGEYFYSSASAGVRIDCTLKNISPTGACIDTEAPLVNGEMIFLHILREKDVTIKSEVVWKKENIYGVLFHLNTSEDLSNLSYILNTESHV